MAVVTAVQAFRAVSPSGVAPAGAMHVAPAGRKPSLKHRALWAVVAILLVVLLAEVFDWAIDDPNFSRSPARGPVQGLTIFAVFFVAAAGIERLLEPLSHALFDDAEKKAEATQALQDAGNVVKDLPDTPNAEQKSAADDAVAGAAQAKANVEWVDFQRAVLFWGLASGVAMLAASALQLYFLRTVGITAGPRWVEILATGLIIGAGTKPLHDVTELISATKDTQKAKAEGS